MSGDAPRRIESLERENRRLRLYLAIAGIAAALLMLLSIYLHTTLDLTRNQLRATRANLESQGPAARARELKAQDDRDRSGGAKRDLDLPKQRP